MHILSSILLKVYECIYFTNIKICYRNENFSILPTIYYQFRKSFKFYDMVLTCDLCWVDLFSPKFSFLSKLKKGIFGFHA